MLQVHAVAAANITMAFTFSGVPPNSLTPAATNALRTTASVMAGGYNPSLIAVSGSPPERISSESFIGFAAHSSQDDLSDVVVKRGKDLGRPVAAGTQVQASVVQGTPQATAVSTPRRLLLGTPLPAPSGPSTSLPVWLTYKYIAPGNITSLLAELGMACNITAAVPVGFDLAQKPCGKQIRAALTAAGMSIDADSYAQTLLEPPAVS